MDYQELEVISEDALKQADQLGDPMPALVSIAAEMIIARKDRNAYHPPES